MDTRKDFLTAPDFAIHDEEGYFKFPIVQFTSEILEDGPILNKAFIIQILESYEEQNKKTKEITKK